MDTDKIILEIIQLPAKFKSVANKSVHSLLRETGYFERHHEIDEFKIFTVISIHPEYIQDWLTWSEDKKTSSGWYLKKVDNGSSIIGYYPETKVHTLKQYSNVTKGCSAFIKLEAEEIRKGRVS